MQPGDQGPDWPLIIGVGVLLLLLLAWLVLHVLNVNQ